MKSVFPRILAALLVFSLVLVACSPNMTPAEPTAAPGSDGGKEPAPPVEPASTEANAEANAPLETTAEDPGGYPAPEQSVQEQPVEPAYPNPLPEGALFQLSLPDGDTVYLTQEDLAGLPQVEVTAGGQNKTGVTLRELLAAHEITRVKTVSVAGQTYSLMFTEEEITDQIIIEVTGDPAVANLIAAGVPPEQWVMQMTAVKVE